MKLINERTIELRRHVHFYLNQLMILEKCVEGLRHHRAIEVAGFETYPVTGIEIIGGDKAVKANRYVIHIRRRNSRCKNRIFIISGTHGPEFFTGNDVHRYILENTDSFLSEEYDIVIISNINPFGALNCTRPDFWSIDYNRNGLTVTEPQLEFPNYAFIKNIRDIERVEFIPESAIAGSILDKAVFAGKLMKLAFALKKDFAPAILGGQSINADIPFTYSGRDTSPGVRFYMDAISCYSWGVENAYVIDVHTGLPGGKSLLITLDDHSRLEADRFAGGIADVESVQFPICGNGSSPYTRRTSDGSMVYPVNGTTIQTAGKISRAVKTTGIIIEISSLSGSLRTLLNILMSNVMVIQNRHRVDIKQVAVDRLRQEMKEIFYPSNEAWRRKAVETVILVLKQIISNGQVPSPSA